MSSQVHSSRHFTLSWGPPVARHRNGIITHYLVRVTTGTQAAVTVNTTQLSVDFPSATFPTVAPATTYLLQVAAGTVAGQGLFTPDTIIQTPEDSKIE